MLCKDKLDDAHGSPKKIESTTNSNVNIKCVMVKLNMDLSNRGAEWDNDEGVIVGERKVNISTIKASKENILA